MNATATPDAPLKKIGDMGRQGDLYVELIDALPDGLQPCAAKDSTILAYGDSGTHHHEIVGDVEIFESASKPGEDDVDLRERFLVVGAGGATMRVARDEKRHEPIPLAAGIYVARIQQVYTPAGIERVYD